MEHCILTLYRLSILDSSTLGFVWNTKLVRRELDLGYVVSTLLERWDKVPREANFAEAEETGCWLYIRTRAAAIGQWWEGKLAAEASEAEKQKEKEKQKELGASNVEGAGKEGQAPQNQNEPMDFGAMNFDLFDDTWMRDFMAIDSFKF